MAETATLASSSAESAGGPRDATPEHTGAVERATESLHQALEAWDVAAEPLVVRFLAAQLVALAEGSAETRAERRREQRARLEILDLSPMTARQILRDLDLPDQPQAADAIVSPHVYHPYRLWTFLNQNPGIADAWSRYSAEAESIDTISPDNPMVALIKTTELTANIALLPGDRTALDRYNVSGLAILAHFACGQIGGIIDAENALGRYAGRAPSLQDFDGLPASASRYVHFGRDALPSPYPGIGIEGCYVVRGGLHEICTLLVVPVLSAPRAARTPADHVIRDDALQVLLDHGRGFPIRYDQGFRRLEHRSDPIPDDRLEERMIAEAWETYVPAAIEIVAGVINDLTRRETYVHMLTSADASPEVADRIWNAWTTLQYDPKACLVGVHPHEEADAIAPYVLGFHAVSAQYPDEGGGLPLASRYWPTAAFVTWIDAFVKRFRQDDVDVDGRGDRRHHGWIDRAVRLVQQAVPNRGEMPDLAGQPEIQRGVRHLLLSFPIEGASLMEFWAALRWMARIDPVDAEMRIHCLIAESARAPAIRAVAHVLFREMPKGPPARRAWADVAQCVADAVDDPGVEKNLAGLVVRAYSADPDLAERLIAQGCSPDTFGTSAPTADDADFLVLRVYGGLLRDLVRTLPNTMTLLRTRDQTQH